MPRTRRGGGTTSAAPSPMENILSKSISTEELREYFECPVCFVVPRPGSPIFACPQGHMLCNQCRPRIFNCPICRISINDDNQMRLYFAERLLEEKVPAQCKFAQFGCTLELTGPDLFKHESEECPFEPMSCDYNHRGCKQKVNRAKKPGHLQTCDFRLVDCPFFSDCKAQVIHKKLKVHLSTEHFGLQYNQMKQMLAVSMFFNVILTILFLLIMM